MSDHKIKITIDKLGKPKIEAIGFNGVGCTEATKPILDALSGGGNVEMVIKPEYNMQESETSADNELAV